MNGYERLEKKLLTCLRRAQKAQETAKGALPVFQRVLKTTENEGVRQVCRQHIRRLRRIVRSSENEIAALTDLLRMVRGEARQKENGHTHPELPARITIRVRVPKDVELTDDLIQKVVLQSLNAYAQKTDARKANTAAD